MKPLLLLMLSCVVAGCGKTESKVPTDERSAADPKAEWKKWDQEQKRQQEEMRQSMHKLVQSYVKYQCEFVADGELIFKNIGGGSGVVIIPNAFNAKRRARWNVTFKKPYAGKSPKERTRILESLVFHVGLGEHLEQLRIGEFYAVNRGKEINWGEIFE